MLGLDPSISSRKALKAPHLEEMVGSSATMTQIYSAAILVMLFCAARQTAWGVAGMAMSSWPSASVMALMTAGGAAMAPASPQPLIPSGLEGQAVTVMPTSND